ncbi:hypothetical protein HEP73_01355 [Xanthomonas sp. GW]|uniref:hypothetical protein n=1 Tax=Xanthomonas sp. GW TaxID=2724121 RepID=UPI001862950F|nr:hypothetical protein [Xanthomonas sp. GW]QNH20455.1 hypothetical protein HEP73_01355 [Xanthomonas sp. GW]
MFDATTEALPAPYRAVGDARAPIRVPALPRLALLMFSVVSTAGCTLADAALSKEQFARQVDTLLGGRDAAEVPASALTAFPWQRLCFERDDALLLKFTVDGHERVLALPYEEFFVDEGHVKDSLEDACLGPGDRILVKKKYPGYAGPVEFRKSGQAG